MPPSSRSESATPARPCLGAAVTEFRAVESAPGPERAAYLIEGERGVWVGHGVRRHIRWQQGRVWVRERSRGNASVFWADLRAFGDFLERCGTPLAGYLTFEAGAATDGVSAATAEFIEPLEETWLPKDGDTCGAGAFPETPRHAADWTEDVSRTEYVDRVRVAQRSIARGLVAKVILSRGLSRPWPRSGSLAALLAAFLAHGGGAGRAVALELGTHAVVGITPEPLLDYRAGRLRSAVLAGTRGAGIGRERDAALVAELLASGKERREHALAAREAEELLAATCGRDAVQRVRSAEPVACGPVVHLVTELEAAWPLARRLGDLFAALLPAVTVSGVPRASSMALIATLERRPRGLYAGAVGRVEGRREGSLLLPIRCAFRVDGRLVLRSGAGILAESEPEAEWAESERKLALPLAAVGRWEASH